MYIILKLIKIPLKDILNDYVLITFCYADSDDLPFYVYCVDVLKHGKILNYNEL